MEFLYGRNDKVGSNIPVRLPLLVWHVMSALLMILHASQKILRFFFLVLVIGNLDFGLNMNAWFNKSINVISSVKHIWHFFKMRETEQYVTGSTTKFMIEMNQSAI